MTAPAQMYSTPPQPVFDIEQSVKFITGGFVMSCQPFEVDRSVLCHVLRMPLKGLKSPPPWAKAFLARAQQLSLNLTTISEQWCELCCVM